MIQKIYKGVMWALDNAGQILCILQKAFGLLKQAISPGGKGAVAKGVFGILKGAVGVLLKLLGKLLGLDALPTAINAVLNTLKMQVEKWITNLLARLLKRKKKVTPCKLKPGKPMVKKPGGKFELTLGCSDKAKDSGQCFTGDTLVRGPAGLVLLAQRLPGRLVLTYPDSASETAVSRRAEREGLRLIHLELDYGGGDGVEALLLRGEEWLAAQCVLPGGVLWLDMPEMGAVGWAWVKEVMPCPPLEEGAGQRVTGWFRHWRGEVYDLRVQGEAKAIGVTWGHPFWSMDRGDWVPVSELRVGERLLAWDGGTPVVESLGLREVPEAVYNIEVEGDHCYRVGQQGLLVHNDSAPVGQAGKGQVTGAAQQCSCAARLAEYRKQGFTPSRIVREEGISTTLHYLWQLGCNIAHAAGVMPRTKSTPVVAVALVCEEGSNAFKIYVSYNLLRGSDAVRAATETVLGPGHWIDPQPPTHAEQNILNYFQSAQHRGDIAGVAASRCICSSCVSVLSTGNQLASPRGSAAVPTCNQDGTAAITGARQWCQDGRSPIPFNQQF